MYGAADQWNGVGIFFDSFDNDGKVSLDAILITYSSFFCKMEEMDINEFNIYCILINMNQ